MFKYLAVALLIVSAGAHASEVYMYSAKDKKILPYINGGEGEVRYCTDSKIKKQQRQEAFDTISEACGGNLYTITADVHAVFAPRAGGKEMIAGCKAPGQVISFKCNGTKPSGRWEFAPANSDGVCSATYTQKQGSITLRSPDNTLEGGAIIFSGPNIPSPSRQTDVKISLSENKEKAITFGAINGVFDSTPNNYGSVMIPISEYESMLNSMQDNHSFTISRNKTVWISIDWNQGKRIKEKLTDCYVQNILHK
ncbi:hypothetical protein [Sulfuricurvum sp.]|uniref:hypothetical protein n=1 Tax=Sulfuricurvum sp. TaxID=2025608 RepID=UPI0026032CFD|nr:hypothetical protein [Sulfuricurvum sp.]MDD3596636.1 hypothetical protein [Sulfuricurvum sp.]